MFVFMVGQATDEWWQVRRGIPTASEFDKVITPAKGELSKSALKYMATLIADTFDPTPNYFSRSGFSNTAIEDGKVREAESRRWLALDLGESIDEVGFCVNEDFTMGCSPDGLIRLDVEGEAAGEWRGIPYFRATAEAGVELKNPQLHTQAERLLVEVPELPLDYKVQPHGQMIVCGVKKVYWASYAPPLAPVRVDVTWDSYTDKVAAAAKQFAADYNQALQRMRR